MMNQISAHVYSRDDGNSARIGPPVLAEGESRSNPPQPHQSWNERPSHNTHSVWHSDPEGPISSGSSSRQPNSSLGSCERRLVRFAR